MKASKKKQVCFRSVQVVPPEPELARYRAIFTPAAGESQQHPPFDSPPEHALDDV
jgi:hypothetical protein